MNNEDVVKGSKVRQCVNDAMISMRYAIMMQEIERGEKTMNLFERLMNLESNDSSQGVWIDPDNYDDHRIGQICFENGEVLDDKIFIGTFEELQYLFASSSPEERELQVNYFLSEILPTLVQLIV